LAPDASVAQVRANRHNDPMKNDQGVWQPFVASAIALSVIAGFGLGGGLFSVGALDRSSGAWWAAAAQAHGHIQYVGWAGLMVLGVGLHFVPRLAGAPSISRRRALQALALLVAGLMVRAVAQPLLAEHASGATGSALRASLVGSASAELAGAVLAVATLGRTLRGSRNLRAKPELRSVFPFFVLALCGLLLALIANVAGVLDMTGGTEAVIDRQLNDLTLQLAFYAFLIPISIAMSARTFPLYARTVPARPSGLIVVFALMVTGLLLRAAGDLLSWNVSSGGGRLIQGLGLLLAILALGVFGSRVPLPRREVRILSDPVQLHLVTAYCWLGLASFVLANAGIDQNGWRSFDIAETVEWHALGAGFVTMLILGVGQLLLPGFARKPLRDRRLLWVTVALGNLAAILRIVPVLAGTWFQHRDTMLALSGFIGLATLCVFAMNVGVIHRRKQPG
jgi:uncharacterized protein involved in response to NO